MSYKNKLSILLQIAINNGWTTSGNSIYLNLDHITPHITSIDNNLYCFYINILDKEASFSMDSIVNSNRPEYISFIQALCNANPEAVANFRDFNNSAVENIVFLWNFTAYQGKQRLTSERLNFLFDTFKHLLVTEKSYTII